MRTSSPLAVRVVKRTTHASPHASTRLPALSRMPRVTWMRYVVSSRRNVSLMPASVFVAGSKVSWRSPLAKLPESVVMKKSESLTESSLIAPVNGTTTRGWRSNPSSLLSSAKASQIE